MSLILLFSASSIAIVFRYHTGKERNMYVARTILFLRWLMVVIFFLIHQYNLSLTMFGIAFFKKLFAQYYQPSFNCFKRVNTSIIFNLCITWCVVIKLPRNGANINTITHLINNIYGVWSVYGHTVNR